MMGQPRTNRWSVRFRGVRGSLPSPAPENMRYGGNTSCVEIRYREQLMILDAGSGIRSLGDELIRDSGPVKTNLLLSHTHWDHIQGLPFFSPGYLDDNEIVPIVAHGRAGHFQQALANQMGPAHFPVPLAQMRGLRPVEELGEGATRLDNLSVRTIELNHPGGCTGFRVESPAGSVAYLPDHEPYQFGIDRNSMARSAQQTLVDFLNGVDVLILDTQYTNEEYLGRIGWGHGCLADSVRLALDAGAGRLIMFHHDPSHTDRKIDQMVEAARSIASGGGLTIDGAAEGGTLILNDKAGPIATRQPAVAAGDLIFEQRSPLPAARCGTGT